MDLIDLARNISGFAVADLGPGQSQMAIRGISSGQVIRDQPGVKPQVGVYLDNSPISIALFTPDLELFDLDRFEVLRGPQGTLFGEGSEAGTVRYITRQPQLGRTETYADAAFEDVEHGSQGGFLRAALNLPFGDAVAMRLAAYWHHLAGFIDEIQPGGTVAKDANTGDRGGARLALLIQPNDNLSITPRVVFQKLVTNGYPRVDIYNILGNPYTTTQPAVTIGPLQQYTQRPDGMTDDFTLADLNIIYNFGPVTLTSITAYTNRHLLVLRDATQLTGSVTFDVFGPVSNPPNPAGVRTDSPLFDRTGLNVITQELRLASNGTQTIDWLVGGYFEHWNRRYGQDLPTAGYDTLNNAFGQPLGPKEPLAVVDDPFTSDLAYHLKQYAAFGEATWHATDKFGVTAGLRYYNFTENRILNFHGYFAVSSTNVPGATDSNGVTPRLILSYKPTNDVLFSAQASRGFRLGGINDPINLPVCSPNDRILYGSAPVNWQDEKAWNYELAAKTQWLERRLTFNLALFYTDIKNLQANVTAGSCSSRLVYNVPTSRSQGVEAELFARPNYNWDFGLSLTVADAKLTSSVTAPAPPPGAGTVIIGGLQDGNRLPTAPKTQAAAFIGYQVPVQGSMDFFANLTGQYVGSSFSQFENEEPNFGGIGTGLPNSARLIQYGAPLTVNQITFNPELPSYTILNFRFGLKQARWQTALYLNNLTDKSARLALDYERGRSARVGYLTNQPRTYGVYGSYSW